MSERDIARPPIEASEWQKKAGYKHACPKCGCALGNKDKKNGLLPRFLRRTVLYEVSQPYCAFCGQHIDWTKQI